VILLTKVTDVSVSLFVACHVKPSSIVNKDAIIRVMLILEIF